VASANKFIIDDTEYVRVTDTGLGRRLQYAVKIGKFTARQLLVAHNEALQAMEPVRRQNITNKEMKDFVLSWLDTPREIRTSAKLAGVKSTGIEPVSEVTLKAVFASYLAEYCNPAKNSPSAIANTRRQCARLIEYFESKRIVYCNNIKRDDVTAYAQWRSNVSTHKESRASAAGTINKELQRLAAVLKYGVKYHGLQELYVTDGIRVRHTQENTKTIRPFEIGEVKAILAWLWSNAEAVGNWYLHDMVLLAVCAGLEAKALSLLTPGWFKLDLGILRVYDKLVSGVINAKTQNRARDIPLTPTLRKIFERGYVFKRPTKKKGDNLTRVHEYSRKAFARCERETGIVDVDWHRFRHTYATARLSAGWQLVRVSRMLGHSNVGTTASHYAEFDLSASPEGFEGMIQVYGEFVRWLDGGYF